MTRNWGSVRCGDPDRFVDFLVVASGLWRPVERRRPAAEGPVLLIMFGKVICKAYVKELVVPPRSMGVPPTPRSGVALNSGRAAVGSQIRVLDVLWSLRDIGAPWNAEDQR